MVFGFIFRGVAFEFRSLARRKLLWNYAFGAGSFLAALGQGFALGAVLKGIAVDKSGHFIGTTWDWLSWQSVLVALTLIQGYVLIGSTYLVWKTTGELQTTHYKTAKLAAWTTLIGAVFITISTPIFYATTRSRLFEQPLVYIFALIPLLGVLLIWQLLRSLNRQEERAPFVWTILLFVLTFIGLGLIVFPYIMCLADFQYIAQHLEKSALVELQPLSLHLLLLLGLNPVD